MRSRIDMKKYILDQIILFAFLVGLIIVFYFLTSEIVSIMIVMEIIIVWSFSSFLKSFFGLLIDFLQGGIEQEVYFSSQRNIQEYEFFRENFFCKWYFYYSAKGTLTLLVPVCQTYEEILKMDRPEVDQKVRVCYYRHSKILYAWEVL